MIWFRKVRAALAIVAVAAIAATIFLMWLFWPLPDASFDWRGLIAERIEAGKCRSVPSILMAAADAQPEVIDAFIGGRSVQEICPMPPEAENFDMFEEGRTAYLDNLISEIIAGSPSRSERMEEGHSGFGAALEAIRWTRNQRREAGLGSMGWPEIVIGFRCELALETSRQSAWYRNRSILISVDEVAATLPAWEQRREWCRSYAAEELRKLRERISTRREALPKGTTIAHELQQQYEAWILLWSRPEDQSTAR